MHLGRIAGLGERKTPEMNWEGTVTKTAKRGELDSGEEPSMTSATLALLKKRKGGRGDGTHGRHQRKDKGHTGSRPYYYKRGGEAGLCLRPC